MRSTDRPLLDHLEREEREVQRRLSVLRRRRLADKSQALAEAWEQVREGTYGLCRACGGRIVRVRGGDGGPPVLAASGPGTRKVEVG